MGSPAPLGARAARAGRGFGALLRQWRQRRRYTQLALALETGSSARHLSFLETGRAAPSRGMVHRLAEHLEIPPRERNALLVAAGYAPAYAQRPLEHEAMGAAREAVQTVLAGFEPFPALAVDRHWTLRAANRTVEVLLAGVAPRLLEPPVNVLRLSLHPQGLAPRIVNRAAWSAFVLSRLQRDATHTADPALERLLEELRALAGAEPGAPPLASGTDHDAAFAIPLELRTEHGVLSLISTTTVFGTAVEVALAELAIECFLPGDAATRRALHALAPLPTR